MQEEKFDYVIVGSGINSLCCAGLLAKKGHSVCVLERNDYLGGCIKTAEVTLPDFKHDVLSGFHPLFVTSPTYAVLKDDLSRHGLEYVNTEKPTGAINAKGEGIVLTTSREKNIETLNKFAEGDGDRYAKTMQDMEKDAELTFALLGSDLLRLKTFWLLLKQAKSRGVVGLFGFFGETLRSSRDWLTQHIHSPQGQALLAPWILHTGLSPEANLSGAMNRLIAFSLEAAGMPIVKGGSSNLVQAFKGLIEENNGKLITNAHVNKVLVENGRAVGVEVSAEDGKTNYAVHADKAVICNVTPNQLYEKLIDSQWVPQRVQSDVANYQYGRADMQIHLALDAPPQWLDNSLNDVAMIHVTDGVNAVSKAINEAERGLLPEECTIVVAQPTALDSSRAPDGKAILWIQLQELPSRILGDAANEIDVPESGEWTEAVKNAYAERVLNRLEHYIPGLNQQILDKCIISPADLEHMNINLVGGDPYGGDCGLQQFFAWRPLKSVKNHETPVKHLYHIGASTHPGPGLGGNSGFIVAQALSK